MSESRWRATLRARRKRLLWGGGAAAALAAAATTTLVVLGATESEGDADCWGAWGGVESPWSGGDVAVSGTPPSEDDPEGECTVVVTMQPEDEDADEDESWQHRLEVSYGPLPEDRADLAAWPLEHLRGDASPLPDGLSGGVSAEHGLLVLPERCRAGGGPWVVTMTTRYSEVTTGRGDASHGSRPARGPSHMAELLVGVARQGMADAGCAADEEAAGEAGEAGAGDADGGAFPRPDEVSPVQRTPSVRVGEQHLCGHADLPKRGQAPPNPLHSREQAHFHAWSASVGIGDGDHTCSSTTRRNAYDWYEASNNAAGPPTSGTVLFSTADPDMIRLLEAVTDGMGTDPIDGWGDSAVHGGPLAAVTAECENDREESVPHLFLAYSQSNAPELLADYVRAVETPRGCEGVAPDA